jgi:hypothetical protein
VGCEHGRLLKSGPGQPGCDREQLVGSAGAGSRQRVNSIALIKALGGHDYSGATFGEGGGQEKGH